MKINFHVKNFGAWLNRDYLIKGAHMSKITKGSIHSSFWSNIFSTSPEKNDFKILLRAVPLFVQLSKKDISLLINIMHLRNYLAGEFIFYQNDPGIGMYIIREGEVTIQRTDENGNVFSLANFSKGDFFGELALVDEEKRSASAVAISEVQIAVIFKPDLDNFVSAYPKKGIKILEGIEKVIVKRLRNLNDDYFKLVSETKIKSENNYGT